LRVVNSRSNGPANHLAGEQVEDHGQIEPALAGRNLGDIRQPDLIWPVRDKILLERWRAHFGPDRWVDVEGYRLIGFDALLLDSGEREEALQAEWLDAIMNDAEGRRIAWFLHRPLFLGARTKMIPDIGPSSRSRAHG